MNDDKKPKESQTIEQREMTKVRRHTLRLPHGYSIGGPHWCEWEWGSAVIV